MPDEKVVWVKCQFSRGGFPTELLFHIPAPAQGTYTGIAPRGYCYGQDWQPIRDEVPRGQKLPGYLPGIAFGSAAADQPVRVYLPDGEVYEIERARLERKGEPAGVLLQS
jgi:hypothetical protein